MYAADLRLPWLELRAWWVLRSADYRHGVARFPDEDLLEAARHAPPRAAAAVRIGEAAIAWRAGDLQTAHRLAAAVAADPRADALSLAFARGLVAACSGDDRDRALAGEAAAAVSSVRAQAQVYALVGWAQVPEGARLSLLARIDESDQRFELLSGDEVHQSARRMECPRSSGSP
jgi:hypothetical protein